MYKNHTVISAVTVALLGIVASTTAGLALPANENLTLVGHIQTGGTPRDMIVSGDYAYVAAGLGGLRIVDISNPGLPVEIGHVETGYNAFDVEVNGNLAYMTDAYFRVINITDPTAPLLINTVGSLHSGTMAMADGYLYLASTFYGVRVVDLTNPSHPQVIGSLSSPGTLGIVGLTVAGDLAYVPMITRSSGILWVVDLSDPASPQEIVKHVYDSFAWNFAVQNQYAYLSSFPMEVWDVAAPASPIVVGTLSVPAPQKIVVAGGCAYMASYSDGVRYIDVTDPSAPSEAGFFTTGGNVENVVVDGGLIFALDTVNGLWILQNDAVGDVPYPRTDPGLDLAASPNPFNPRTTITVTLGTAQSVEVSVHDLAGRRVAQLANRVLEPGTHAVTWNGRDASGRAVSSGTYLVRATSGAATATQKLVLVR